MNKKSFKPTELSGVGVFLLKPVISLGKKCYEKFLEKENSFGINVTRSEVKIKQNEKTWFLNF